MADQLRGSNVTLYFAEEEQFGKPNVTYDSTKKRVVATRVTAGVDNIDVTKAVSTDLAANDWVAIYSGDYQGVVQLMKVKSVSSKTITFDDNLQFPIAPNDTVEKVTNFNPKEIYPITGMVNFSPSLEIGQITSEASEQGKAGKECHYRQGVVTSTEMEVRFTLNARQKALLAC